MMPGVVTVDIGGQRYPIRSGLDPAYVIELAAYVDQKMRAASEAAPSTDMLSLAILVALNLADECFRARQKPSVFHGELHERTLRIEQLLDRALGAS
jgi:cell division protein ZapA